MTTMESINLKAISINIGIIAACISGTALIWSSLGNLRPMTRGAHNMSIERSLEPMADRLAELEETVRANNRRILETVRLQFQRQRDIERTVSGIAALDKALEQLPEGEAREELEARRQVLEQHLQELTTDPVIVPEL